MVGHHEWRLSAFGSFVDGHLEGTQVELWPEGGIRRITHYSNGQPDGSDVLFSNTGILLEVTTWRTGQVVRSTSFSDVVDE